MTFIRFIFNVHSKIRAFPFDENFLAFTARFITRDYTHVTIVILVDLFLSVLHVTAMAVKTWPLNVTHVSWQDRIKGPSFLKHK